MSLIEIKQRIHEIQAIPHPSPADLEEYRRLSALGLAMMEAE